MIQFKNDKAVVTLDALCNSADPSKPMDDIDGLVRFCNLNSLFLKIKLIQKMIDFLILK